MFKVREIQQQNVRRSDTWMFWYLGGVHIPTIYAVSDITTANTRCLQASVRFLACRMLNSI